MARFMETYRTTVDAAQCDALGHLNIQHYYAALWEGAIVLISKLGLPPDEIARRGIGFAAARVETDFRRELRAGDELVLESALERLGRKSITVLHCMRHGAGGEPVMESVVTAVLMDLHERTALPIPDDLRASARPLLGPGA